MRKAWLGRYLASGLPPLPDQFASEAAATAVAARQDLKVRTWIVSDLHLGSPCGGDLLRQPEIRAQLISHLCPGDRLVLLGDVLERGLSQQTLREQVRPVFEDLARALGNQGEILFIVGNHDHWLLAPWLAKQPDLGLQQTCSPQEAGEIPQLLTEGLACPVRFAYPGVWLRDDVYAWHGHYADVHSRLPAPERAVGGLRSLRTRVSARGGEKAIPGAETVVSDRPGEEPRAGAGATAGAGWGERFKAHTVNSYERALSPFYLWKDARLRDSTREAKAAPLGLALQRRTGWRLREAATAALLADSLFSLREAARQLDIRSAYLISGHSHLAGPWPEDRPEDWTTHHGGRILNSGSWFMPPATLASCEGGWRMWPGTVICLGASGPPRLRRILS